MTTHRSDDAIPFEYYTAAADFVRQRMTTTPTVGLILGSGLGPLVDEIQEATVIPFLEIPHWPVSTVPGHAGRLVLGTLEGVPVLAMQGRLHFYEGYSMAQVVLPVRVMKLLGVETLIVTNAAGGLNPSFSAGDIMVIADHIFIPGMAGYNPLRGANQPEFGPRFAIYTQTYSPALRALAMAVAEEHQLTLREGVYMGLAGPAFETPAEVRMLRAWGGDAVGMSTAPEVLAAYHSGMRVLGLSTITNMAIDSTATVESVSHEEVLRLGRQVVPRLAVVIRSVLRRLPPYDSGAVENRAET